MKKALGLLVVVVAASVASVSTAGGSPSTLLAAVGQGQATRLTAVDPLTLEPVGRSTQIGRYASRWARSPDGTKVVLARDDRASLRVVDVRAMKTIRAFSVGGGSFDGLAWVKPRLLIAVVDGFVVLGVDPVTKQVRWRQFLQNRLEAIHRVANGFVLLARAGESPATGLGPTELFAVGADGSTRSVALDSIRSGEPDYTTTPVNPESRIPGLAVDEAGGRAYVIGAGEPVAEVDLRSMSVTYHGGTRTLAKVISGPERTAVWLGNGLIAVTGTDAHVETVTVDGREEQHTWSTPAGLTVLDTRDWSWRTIDRNATAVVMSGPSLLASSSVYDSRGPADAGMGVAAYSLDGTPRFHLLGRSVVGLIASGTLAYAITDGVTIIDVASGRVVGTSRRSDVVPLIP